MSSRLTLAELFTKILPAGHDRFLIGDRASWLEMRTKDVTASAIAALVGEHPAPQQPAVEVAPMPRSSR